MQTWILLRGLTRETAHWGDFINTLRQALPDAHILALDLSGNGQRHRELSPSTVRAMLSACRADAKQLDLQGPVHLLAMSLGAMVAVEWARTAPEELASCVLINTSLQPFNPFYQRLLPRNYLSLMRIAMGHLPAEAIEQTILQFTSNHPDRHAGVIEQWVATRVQRPVSRLSAVHQLLAATRYRAPDQRPEVPMLLLSSARDRLVSSQCSQAIAGAWHCPLKIHPTAGHDLPLDDPQWVTQQAVDWLSTIKEGTLRSYP